LQSPSVAVSDLPSIAVPDAARHTVDRDHLAVSGPGQIDHVRVDQNQDVVGEVVLTSARRVLDACV
jgi:hypothetical protein